jgi:nucleotide-binding universal stress UspA family protein/RimJ/RimL family protein N-acetyltransferase
VTAPASITLRDGSRVAVRPLTADDKELLRAGFERLSMESRYRRFFSPLPRLSTSQLRYLTELDHHDHEALAAIEPATGALVAVARYVRSHEEPRVAEIAVTVVDDWQGRGLGGALQDALADRAREEGIDAFSAVVQADNEASLAMLEGLGDAVLSSEGTTVELRIALPDRGAGDRWQDVMRAAAASSVLVVGSAVQRAASATAPRRRRRRAPRPAAGFRTIVTGTDGSLTAQQAARVGFELARATDARLHIVSAYNAAAPSAVRKLRAWVPDTVSPLSWIVAGREDADTLLAAAADAATSAFDLQPQVHAVDGDPADALMAVAEDHDADLIVVGSKGAVADKLARRAPCSVLIVKTTS